MKKKERIVALAHLEIGWWKAHHRRQKEEMINYMTQLYVLQFKIGSDKAKMAVIYRAEAAIWHDKAEALEDEGEQERADIFWVKAEECLRKHFEVLART
jgi:hypothetical protein